MHLIRCGQKSVFEAASNFYRNIRCVEPNLILLSYLIWTNVFDCFKHRIYTDFNLTYNLQLYLFYIFTITYFCSNISIFTLYGCVMDVLILLNIVCTVRKCLVSLVAFLQGCAVQNFRVRNDLVQADLEFCVKR